MSDCVRKSSSTNLEVRNQRGFWHGAPLAFALLAVLAAGCGKTPVYENVYMADGIEVRLRYDPSRDERFQHPVSTTDQAIYAMLSRLEIKGPDARSKVLEVIDLNSPNTSPEDRLPVVPGSVRQRVAEEIATALAGARPDQSVSVSVLVRERRLGILFQKYLSTFLVFQQDGRLLFDLSRVSWEMPRNWRKDKPLPAPRRNANEMELRIISIPEVVEVVSPQVAAVTWPVAPK
jgi:hypothetical protein